MRVQLFCICSLLAFAFAFDDVANFAPHGDGTSDVFVSANNHMSAALNFPFLMNGVQMQSIRISSNGAVFPSTQSVGSNVAPSSSAASTYQDFSSNTFAILGPLWGGLYISSSSPSTPSDMRPGLYYRILNSANDHALLRIWGNKVSADHDHKIDPVRGLVVTWWQMKNPSQIDAKIISAQLVIIIDASNVAWAFYNYGDFQWSPLAYTDDNGDQAVDLRIGYTTANGATTEYYNTFVSGTSNVYKQTNFYFKLSTNPRVDNYASKPNYNSVPVTVDNKYIGQGFTVTATSNGPTAFNFFKPGGASFALPGSKLVCFTSVYTGPANAIATASADTVPSFFARSNVASAEGVWIFPANYVFLNEAGKSYYCYIDTKLPTQTKVVSLQKATRGHGSSYLTTTNGNSFTGGSSATSFAYQFQSVLYGKVQNDPVFSSLRDGENFIFKGEAGKHFNIYNDQWTNLNAEFKYANAAHNEGTVMNSVGVMVGGHKISFAADDFSATALTVSLDGKQVKLVDELVHLSGCVDVHYKDTGKGMYFYIVSPTHVFKFWQNERHTDHIDGNFINLNVEDVPQEINQAHIGGVLGQTARTGPVNLKSADFEATGLFGEESSRFFKSTEFDC